MATIDERVVSMAFENQVFEQRIQQTLSSLNKLDASLKKTGANQSLGDIEKSANKVTLEKPMSAMDKLRAKFSRGTETKSFEDIEKASNKVTLEGTGKAIDKTQAKLDHLGAGATFTDIEKASNQVELSGISRAISNVSNQFSVLQGAAAVALGNIASQATMRGATFAKGFALGPITDGLNEYKTNLNSIQTILANTQGQQVSGLDEVNKHLNELNTYSDQTIYNFSEMAKNIGTFTAAGVDMDKSTQSIKGIANLAALSGSNSQQASTAMYQLSQAIAAGRVGLQDWNSVVNAGMGGAVFQKSLMRTAENMGALKDGAVQIDKATGKATVNGESFRNSIMAKPGEESWLTSDVLVETLKQFTGDMKESDLVAQGFSADQAKAIVQQARTAKAAATEVKTLSQAFDVAKETIGSGWSKTFQLIFGDFEESKKTFTEFSNTLNGFINQASNARNKVLGEWKKLGGRTVLIDGIKQAFSNLMDILGTVKTAFENVFPPATGKSLFALTKSFTELMQNLKPSPELLNNLTRIFSGLFAVMHIGWSIVKGVVGVITDLLGVAGKGSSGFLGFAGGIGDFLVAVDKALTQGGLLKGFFETLSGALKSPVQLIMQLASAFLSMFGFANQGEEFGKKVGDSMGALPDKLAPLKAFLDKAAEAWRGFLDILRKVGDFLDPFVAKFKTIASDVGNALAGSFTQANFDNVIKAVQTGLLGGLFLQIRKLMTKGIGVDVGGGFLKNLSGTFKALTGHLEAMQKNVQASMLLKIAAALGLLAAAAFVFSTIPPDKLSKAMGAMAVGLGQLVAAMVLMMKVSGGKGFIAIPALAAGMVLMAGAMVILAAAVKIFSTMNWDELARGLAGVGGGLAIIAVGMKFLGPGSLVQGPALIAIALALNLLAAAVKQLSELSWEELGKGLLGIAVGVGLMVGAMALMPPNMAANGLALMAMAFGVTVLAGAVAAMGKLDVQTIAKGIGGIALAMLALAFAITGFPPTLALQAAGLILVGIALKGIAGAVGMMGGMSIGKLVKGLAAMGIALAELAVGLFLMQGSAGGAVALLAAAAAFAILAPALALMGNLEWSTILKGLATMALTMGLLAVAGVLVAAPLAVLGAALIVLGAGLLPVALGAMLLAKAFQILGAEGTKGVAILIGAIGLFVASIPKMIVGFLQGIGDVLTTIAELAPKLAIAIGVVVNALLFALAEAIPKAALVIGRLLTAIVDIITQHSAPVIAAGINLLVNLLEGISQNIGRVVQTASDIVVKFLNGLTQNAPRITQSGLGTMVAFLTGISNGIPRIVGKVAEMVGKFLSTVTARIPSLVTKGAAMIVAFINGVASKVGDIVAAGAHLIGQFLVGIGNKIPELVQKGLFVARKFMNGVADGMVGLAHIGFEAIIKFLNGIEAEIRNNSRALLDAGKGIGDAIFDGVAMAIDDAAGPIIDKLKWVFSKLPGPVKKVLGIKSPSTVFAEIGKNTVDGFAKGVLDNRTRADQASADMGKSSMQSLSKAVVAHRMAPEAQFHEVGKRSMQGLSKGLKENEGEVKSTSGGIVGGLIGVFKDMLQIRSPSRVLHDIGKSVGEGFAQGLHGSKEDIRGSFKDLRETLGNEIRTQRDNIKEENKKIRDLQQQHQDKMAELQKETRKKKPDAATVTGLIKDLKDISSQIKESQKAVDGYENILGKTSTAHNVLTGSLQEKKKELVGLAKDFEQSEKDLVAARDKLAEVKATFDEVVGTFYQLPNQDQLLSDALAEAELSAEEIEAKKKKIAEDAEKRRRIDQVANYKKALEEQIAATKKYQETLAQLRAMGLDDATYKKLLAKGVEGQEFASQIATGGAKGIQELNALDAQLLAVSQGIGEDASKALHGVYYQVGVDSAQGLVDGLVAKQKDLQKAMDVIADGMVARIKNALGVKSPSRVFMEIGGFLMKGLSQGVQDNQNGVDSSIRSAAQKAIDAAKESFGNMDMASVMDVQPTITPVLDLSQVQKDASKLGELTNVTPITAAASFGQASAISMEQQAALAEAAAAGKNVTQVEFNQYNNSPESLSDTEIYRQTNNQLSQLRSALGLTPKGVSA